jgi:hypothetical protein
VAQAPPEEPVAHGIVLPSKGMGELRKGVLIATHKRSPPSPKEESRLPPWDVFKSHEMGRVLGEGAPG